MTRLFIDGKEVALDKDLELEYTSCNPFFTKKGDFTYDLDIDLKCPQNAKIYQHIDRHDTSKCPTNRKAILMSDSRVIIEGTEIILSVESNKAKIQIVGSNSELNYLSGNGLKVREMDFGTITVDRNTAKATLEGCFPEYNYVCPPVYTGYETDAYTFNNRINLQGEYYADTKISPQPYLLYYVEKIVELLGYTLEENFLRDDKRWCRLYLVNGIDTLEYAKMLPDWTADEFITEIEKFFNCVFIVNRSGKKVRIVDVKSCYANSAYQYINLILDESIEKTYDADDDLYINYDNVSFDFPDLRQYKYDCLNQEIIKLCTSREINSHTDFGQYDKEAYDKHIIYHTKDYGLDFILVKQDENQLRRVLVNRFSSIEGPENSDTTSLKLIPAEIYGGGTLTTLGAEGLFTCAYARNTNPMDDTTGDTGLYDMIQNGIPEEEVPDRIYIALYAGKVPLFSDIAPDVYHTYQLFPMTRTDTYYYITTSSALALVKFEDENLTLILKGEKGLYENYYKGGIKVNTTTEYHFSFIPHEHYDPSALFIINNKPYYCKELKYKVEALGLNKVVEGIFYLIE